MGNRGRREAIVGRLAATLVNPTAPVLAASDVAIVDALLSEHIFLVAIGFDTLQVPRVQIVYEKN